MKKFFRSKKILFAFFLFPLSVLQSCAMSSSETESESALSDDDVFLKSAIESEYEKTQWTENLSDISKMESSVFLPGARKNIAQTPENAIATEGGATLPVYPSIEGFGSLDTSALSKECRQFLDSFCKSLSQGEESAFDFMRKDREYLLSLFLFDAKEKWESAYSEPFPEKERFSSWRYAAPFFAKDLFLVKVCFFLPSEIDSKGFFNVELFLDSADGKFSINQIRFAKGGKSGD